MKVIHAILSNLRLERSGHYVALILVGATFGALDFPVTKLNGDAGFYLLASVFAVLAAYQSSCVLNDFFDQTCDRICNPTRPLVANTLSVAQYRNYGIISFCISLLFACFGGYQFFYLLLGCHALSWLYSVPPFRLKRFFPINIFIIAAVSWFLLLGGYSIIANGQAVERFPGSLLVWSLVFLPLVISIKDLGDEVGDREDGVVTLVTLVGKRRAARLLSIALFVIYLVTPFLFNLAPFWPLCLIAGFVCSTLLWRSPTYDRFVLVVYLLLIVLAIVLLLSKGGASPNFLQSLIKT